MFPVLQVGPLAIQTPGLILILGLWLSLNLAERHVSRYSLTAETLDNLVLTSMIAGIIGARLGYLIRYPSAFFGNPISLLSLNPGLLDPWFGLGSALIFAFAFGQRKQIALWPTLDALAPGIAVACVALGFSHLASGAAFGLPADVPWAINLWGANRHPSQVYEILVATLILGLFWPGKGPLFPRVANTPGLYFLSVTAASAIARIFLEAFRGDSVIIINGIRLAQVISWLILAATLLLIGRRRSIHLQEEQAPIAEGTQQV